MTLNQKAKKFFTHLHFFEELLYKGTFFNEDTVVFDCIHNNYDTFFVHGDTIMYYLNYTGYNISFLWDQQHKQCKAELLEINNFLSVTDQTLKSVLLFNFFYEKYGSIVESVYGDDDEKIVFLKSGTNVYFNNLDEQFYLKKITSPDIESRKLVIKIMKKLM